MNKKEIEDLLYKVNDTLRSLERLTSKCNENTERLNQMMLEMKGLTAAIRPRVKRSGWYGDELNAEAIQEPLNIEFKKVN